MNIIASWQKHKVPAILISLTTGMIGILWNYAESIFGFLSSLYPPIDEKVQTLTILSITLLILLLASLTHHLIIIIKRNKFNICPKCNETTFKPIGIANNGSAEQLAGFQKTRFQCSACGYSKDVLT